MKEFIRRFFGRTHAKCISFQFHNFKFSQGVLDFHVTTATDICMKEVIESSLRGAL